MEPSTTPEEQPTLTTPLLLNPVYARCAKSSMFDELRSFRIILKWCTLDQSSPSSKALSYISFTLFTLLIPFLTSLSTSFPTSPRLGSPVTFNQLIQIPESGLAAIAFFTLSSSFRDHGLRQLLLLDNALRHDSVCIRHSYTLVLDRAFKCLPYILFPTFFIELAHKVIFFGAVSMRVPQVRVVVMFAMLVSWVYRTVVYLVVCVFFRVTCELQILRFEGLYKMFDDGDHHDVGAIFKEHVRIRQQLWVTSHRYRGFIIGCLVTITVSQLGALMLILVSRSEKNFCNTGDIVACSVVQLSGFLLCLLGAATITHRAQRIVSIASRWHMNLCCSINTKSDDTLTRQEHAVVVQQPDQAANDSTTTVPTPPQEVSTSASRQALVMYLQHNGGGITLFGFALDRGLLHTLFAFEMTLVLWILSKVIVLVS